MTTDETLAGLREMATYDCGFEEQSDIALAAADVIVTLLVEVTSLRAKLDAAVELIDEIRNDDTGDIGYIFFKIDKWRGAEAALAKEGE